MTTLIDLVRSMGAEEKLKEKGLTYYDNPDGPWDWQYYSGLDDTESLTILRGLAAEVGAKKRLFVVVYEADDFAMVRCDSGKLVDSDAIHRGPLAEAACCLWILLNGDKR